MESMSAISPQPHTFRAPLIRLTILISSSDGGTVGSLSVTWTKCSVAMHYSCVVWRAMIVQVEKWFNVCQERSAFGLQQEISKRPKSQRGRVHQLTTVTALFMTGRKYSNAANTVGQRILARLILAVKCSQQFQLVDYINTYNFRFREAITRESVEGRRKGMLAKIIRRINIVTVHAHQNRGTRDQWGQ